ncbi:hypothetical protein MMC31_003919 [Peltigera leucophlebia]|nr:hypothetical protein [Peltigera leucophlebia]
MTSTNHTHPPSPSNEPQGIFVYGTLMAEALLSWLLTGSCENLSAILSLRQPAILKTYRRVPVKHGDYPAVIKGNTSDHVDGFLVTPASASQWKKMDDFEGENYRRECVQVYLTESNTTVAADVYLWADEMGKLEENKEWSFSYFEKNRLEDWLDLFDGMEMIG